MKKLLSILTNKKFVYSIISFWVVVQCVFIYNYWGVPQSDDGSSYLKLAQACVDLNTWYPDMHNIDDGYMFAPGFVNLLILIHKIFGAFHYVVILNLLFNFILLYSVYVIAKKLFSENIARIGIVLFCLVFTNLTSPIAILGDLPYTSLVMFSLALLTKDKILSIVFAGLIIALSNWIRPLSIIFVFASVIYMFANKYSMKKYALYFAGIIVMTLIIGLPVKERIGVFATSSNTSGVNLAGTANKYATGLVAFNQKKDPFYAELKNLKFDKNIVEYDKAQRQRAIAWIMENPYDYVKLLPVKLIYLYSIDNWTVRSERGKGFGTLLNAPENTKLMKIKILSFAALQSSFYYIVLILFLMYLWQNRKDVFNKRNIFLLIPFLGTCAVIIFFVTDRYHYPFIPMIIIYASAGLCRFLNYRDL